MKNISREVHPIIMLKGQSHEIFCTPPPGHNRDVLGPFQILANFCEVIRVFNRLPGV